MNARRAQADYSVDDWNREYDSGVYREKWELDRPGPDLVAIAATLGLRSGIAVDLGCGVGTDAIYLASRGLAVVGVDISSAALAIARSRDCGRDRDAALRVSFCEASILALPLQSASVDFANDRGCLHSLRIDDWGRYANELARIMRPGALAAIRGCRDTAQPRFTALTDDRLFEWFGDGRFSIRAVEPLRLCTPRGHISATFMLLERRATP